MDKVFGGMTHRNFPVRLFILLTLRALCRVVGVGE